MLLYIVSLATAGFDYKGGQFTAPFTKGRTEATVDIPIIADFNTNEGTESFSVHLSLQSREIFSDLPYVIHARLGDVLHAEVEILEEIILNFQDETAEVNEGENLILNITASAGGDQNSTFAVSITGNSMDSQCKLIEGSVDVICDSYLNTLSLYIKRTAKVFVSYKQFCN